MAAAGRSPFDLLVGEGYGDIPTWVSPAPVAATAEQIDEVALVLAAADSPLIITEHGGRTDQDRDALVRIAEALSAPVFVFEFVMPAYHNFPRTHPLYGAGPVERVLGEADAILLAGCNAPWHPPLPALRAGCAVIHADEDPMRPRAAYWGYPTTHAVPGKPRAQSRGVGHQSRNPVDRPARSRRALGPLLPERARCRYRGSTPKIHDGNRFRARGRPVPRAARHSARRRDLRRRDGRPDAADDPVPHVHRWDA